MFSARMESVRARAASGCFRREKNEGSRSPGARCGSAGTSRARPESRMASALSLYAASRSAGVGTRAQISAGMFALRESRTESMTRRVSGDEGLNPRGARRGPVAEPLPLTARSPGADAPGTREAGTTVGAESCGAAITAAGTEAAVSPAVSPEVVAAGPDARSGVSPRSGVGATGRAATTTATRSRAVDVSSRGATNRRGDNATKSNASSTRVTSSAVASAARGIEGAGTIVGA